MTRNELLAMPADQYMNTAQLAFFRALLLQMHAELSEREQDVRARLDDPLRYADEGDRALAEEQRWLDLRLRDRETRLRHKIDASLRAIRAGDYGWCERTGEAIGLPRLLARPTTTICADVKVENEIRERGYREQR